MTSHFPKSSNPGDANPGDANPARPGSSTSAFELPIVLGGEVDTLLQDAEVPVVIDFFATWCGPCAWIVPTLRQLSEELGSAVQVIKVDVDEAPALASRYRIGSVPTVVLIEAGTEIGRSIGVEPEKVRSMVLDAVGGGSR